VGSIEGLVGVVGGEGHGEVEKEKGGGGGGGTREKSN
jgi:hypothetical protein